VIPSLEAMFTSLILTGITSICRAIVGVYDLSGAQGMASGTSGLPAQPFQRTARRALERLQQRELFNRAGLKNFGLDANRQEDATSNEEIESGSQVFFHSPFPIEIDLLGIDRQRASQSAALDLAPGRLPLLNSGSMHSGRTQPAGTGGTVR